VQLETLYVQQLVLYQKNESGTIPVSTVGKPAGVFFFFFPGHQVTSSSS
jgi:hypothetical protein